MEQTKKDKLDEIKYCINQEDNLYYIPKRYSEHFEKECEKEGKYGAPIMIDGDFLVYLKEDDSTSAKICLPNFNYPSGTFEKKEGPDHKTFILTPNDSNISKVEIQIHGLDVHKMKLLPGKDGDFVQDTATIRITRHYKPVEDHFEGKDKSSSDSSQKTKLGNFY